MHCIIFQRQEQVWVWDFQHYMGSIGKQAKPSKYNQFMVIIRWLKQANESA